MAKFKVTELGTIDDVESIIQLQSDIKVLLNIDFPDPDQRRALSRKILHEMYKRILAIESRLNSLEK